MKKYILYENANQTLFAAIQLELNPTARNCRSLSWPDILYNGMRNGHFLIPLTAQMGAVMKIY